MVGFNRKTKTMTSDTKSKLIQPILASYFGEKFDKLTHLHQSDKHAKDWKAELIWWVCYFAILEEPASVSDISNKLSSTIGNLNHFGVSGFPVIEFE